MRKLVVAAAGAGIAVMLGLAVGQGSGAYLEARRGRGELLSAERAIAAGDLTAASTDLRAARLSFTRARLALGSLGPLGAVAQVTPLVRMQLRGSRTLASAGAVLAAAGAGIVGAAGPVLAREGTPARPLGAALADVRDAVHSRRRGLDGVDADVRALRSVRLLGPLGRARDKLVVALDRLHEAREALDALAAFAGADAPRRYLMLSQNPDEVRPTGGFVGTYGVLAIGRDRMSLESYDGIEAWLGAHPDVVLSEDEETSPFRLFAERQWRQGLANVNAVADWPTVAALASRLWTQGDGTTVDGVVSFTPGFLVRVLGVTGPVIVREFGETVTAQNARERVDYYAHGPEATHDRKRFIAVLAASVVHALPQTPSSRWPALADAVSSSLAARDLWVWTPDVLVSAFLEGHGWDGRLPRTVGDFLYDAEFQNATKNGSSLRRTFDHHVQVRRDGSARITTVITIDNPAPYNANGVGGAANTGAETYLTVYGPTGAKLVVGGSGDPAIRERELSGHPAWGWFRSAAPQGWTTLTVVWDAPGIVRRDDHGTWRYGIWVLRLPDHTGDVLRLRVDLPKGWRWLRGAPPHEIALDRDVVSTWPLVR